MASYLRLPVALLVERPGKLLTLGEEWLPRPPRHRRFVIDSLRAALRMFFPVPGDGP